MNKFAEVMRFDRELACEALSSGDSEKICDALVSIAYYDEDWRWAQEKFLTYLESADPQIRGLAATCLGHVARIHHVLDTERVLTALHRHLSDPEIAGRVTDALDDIKMFLADTVTSRNRG